ncbi:hypothetical protein V2J09_004282 [Rumex salicifolius]
MNQFSHFMTLFQVQLTSPPRTTPRTHSLFSHPTQQTSPRPLSPRPQPARQPAHPTTLTCVLRPPPPPARPLLIYSRWPKPPVNPPPLTYSRRPAPPPPQPTRHPHTMVTLYISAKKNMSTTFLNGPPCFPTIPTKPLSADMPPHARPTCCSSPGNEAYPPLHQRHGLLGLDHHSRVSFSAECIL